MYDELRDEAEKEDIIVVTYPLAPGIKGLYADRVIAINSLMETEAERACILAEELGHYYTTEGDILDQNELNNRKQEIRAQRWAVTRLICLEDFIAAFDAGIRNQFELAEFLGVTETFLTTTFDHFKRVYGHGVTLQGYTITFDPPGVYHRFE